MISENKLFDSEYRFMDLVWEHQPLKSTELARRCEAALGWKKSTCYTVLKRLCKRGMVKNEETVVMAVVPREDVQRQECKRVVDRNFDGSLPAFVNSFLSERKLTMEEAELICRRIEEAVEGWQNG